MWQAPLTARALHVLTKRQTDFTQQDKLSCQYVFSEFIVTLNSEPDIHTHKRTRTFIGTLASKDSTIGQFFTFTFLNIFFSGHGLTLLYFLPTSSKPLSVSYTIRLSCVEHNLAPSRTGPNCRCCRLLADPSAFLYSIFSTYSG